MKCIRTGNNNTMKYAPRKTFFIIVPYLAYPSNFCLSLNIDWSNPFKEAPYSAGGIYLTVQNLPRTECYKMENIILVGIMPGPQEPKKNINFFLKPLVDVLIQLYHGIKLENSNSIFKVTTIRAILSCIICDMPATRKVCGFLSYHARFDCSKCSLPKTGLILNNIFLDMM